MANKISDSFENTNFAEEGTVGIGFNDVSESGEKSLFANFLATGQLENGDPLIGINLDPSNPEIVIAGTDPQFANSLIVVNQTASVSTLRSSLSLHLTRIQYRISGSFRSIVSQSTEILFFLSLNKEFSIWPATISLPTQGSSLIYMQISPVRPQLITALATDNIQVRMSQAYCWGS